MRTMTGLAELFPIKLSPGFISVAFHLGCIGCNFCSVRYGNARDAIFAAGIHRRYPTGPSEIAALLRAMPAFSKARLPLRLGNDTDVRFEMPDVIDLLERIPSDYPVALLTRFPVTPAEAAKVGRANVVMKLTATPKSPHLSSPDNAGDVVASAAAFETPVLLTIGPITADNFSDCLGLIDEVPRKSNVSLYLKPLNPEFHPSLAAIPQITHDQYRELRDAISRRGLRHVSQMMCCVYGALRMPQKRVSNVPMDERQDCVSCGSYDLCYSGDEGVADAIATELRTLGLRPLEPATRFGFRSYFVQIDQPSGYGDEAYVSERTGAKVKLSGTPAGTGNGRYAASLEVFRRWSDLHFFPYNELLTLTGAFIEESMNAAGARLD